MSDSQTPTVDPYDGQRTTPGPVHPPRYPMNPPVDFESPDTFLQGFPYEAFSGVHESAPIFWHPETKPYEPGFWVLTRFEDVRQVSKDPTLFSSAKGAGPMLSFEGSGYDMTPEMLTIYRANMVGMDPPVHRAYRSVVAPYLSGPAVKRLESAIQDRVSCSTRRDRGRQTIRFGAGLLGGHSGRGLVPSARRTASGPSTHHRLGRCTGRCRGS